MTLENILAKGVIAQNEQFLYLPQYFQLYLTIILSFLDIFRTFANMISKLSAADLLYVGNG